MKWETKSEPYMLGLPIGAMLGIAFWMLFDDPIFGFILGISMAIVFSESGRGKHFAEADGQVLRFGRKGHEKHELSLDDVSAVTFQDHSMLVTSGDQTFELDGAGDEEGLQRFVEELQPLLERGCL